MANCNWLHYTEIVENVLACYLIIGGVYTKKVATIKSRFAASIKT